MRFVLKNVLRRKFRTVFSVLGVGLGISIMVALFTISDDLIRQVTSLFDRDRGDFIIAEATAEDLESRIELSNLEAIKGLKYKPGLFAVPPEDEQRLMGKGVKNATPNIFAMLRTEGDFTDRPGIIYYGVTQDSPVIRRMEILEGRAISDDDPNGVVFGELAWKIVQEKLDADKRLNMGKDLSLLDLVTSKGFETVFGVAPDWEKMSSMQKLMWVQEKLKKLGIHPDAIAEEDYKDYEARTGLKWKDAKMRWESPEEYRKRTGRDPNDPVNVPRSKIELKVRGVGRTGYPLQDAAVFFPLKTAQVIKGMHQRTETVNEGGKRVKREMPSQCTLVLVETDIPDDKALIANLCAQVNASTEEFREFRATPSSEMLARYKELDMIEKFGWVVSIIAALAGALSIMNIMTLSVMERTREIGLMLAVGWSKWRILYLTMAEGLVISFLGGLAGVAFGYAEVQYARHYMAFDYVSAGFNLERALQALGLAFVIGFLATLYPAWRASNLEPIEALRQE
jgi:hypothetical protein